MTKAEADDRYGEDTLPWQLGQTRTVPDYTDAMPLFAPKPAPVAVEPADPSVLPSDVPRLTAAALRVLERLRQGPATNLQLMAPEIGGARFGGRLGDLKAAGVTWTKRHIEGSVWEYRLISCPPELA